MPQDDLYGLAQSAGIVPANDEGGGYYAGIDAPQDPGIQGSSQGLEGRPGVMSGDLTPPQMPPSQMVSPPPPPPDQTGLAPGLQGEGVSAGHTGFNQNTYNQLRGLGSDTDRAKADAITQTRGQEDRMLAPLNAASAEATRANAEVAKANADLDHQRGIEAANFADLNNKFAEQEAKANAEGQAAANTSKANYMASLMELRASKIDPNQLWKSQAGVGQFGMLVSAFVHDFLGAKGIHTTAMDTFNKAIDRNIDSQIEAIKVKGEVTAGFKNLWDMQRAQSASDTEARTRMKGLLLEAATQQAAAHMAQYQSALATAQGHAALAKLHEESAKNVIEVYKAVDNNTVAYTKQNLDIISDNKKYAIESERVGIDRKRLQMERDKAKKDSSDNVIINPETGMAAWEFAPGLEPGEMKTTRDLLANKGEMNKAFNDLRTLMRESKSAPDMIAGTRFAGTDQQRFDSITKRMAHSMVHANGERATDSDVVDYLQGMRPNTWGNQADADKVMAQTQQMMMRETDSYLQQRARDLPADDPRRTQVAGARAPAFAGAAAETDATLNAPVVNPDVAWRKELEGQLTGPQASVKVEDPGSTIVADYQEFLNQYPQFQNEAEKSARAITHSADPAQRREEAAKVWNSGGVGPVQYQASLTRLRENVEKNPADKASRAILEQQALPALNGTAHLLGPQAEAESWFAVMELHKLPNSSDGK